MLYRYARVLSLFYLPFPLLGTSLQWQGTTATWETATNWNPNQVPSTTVGGTDVVTFTNTGGPFTTATEIFANHYLNEIVFTSSAIAYSIAANTGDSLTFNILSGTNPLINVVNTYTATSAISAPLFINGFLSVTQNSASALTLSGVISDSGGGFGITKSGTGILVLSNTNTYSGATTVSAGTLEAGATTAFPSTSAFTVNSPALLDLAGFSNTIQSLQGSGTVTSSNSTATLTISNPSAGGSFSGTLTGINLGLSATEGTLTLTGTSNNYEGATLISNATVQANAAGALSLNSAVTLEDSGELQVNANNTINGLSGDITTTVTISSGDVLTIASGGDFSGTIEGPGSIAVASGTLILSNDNTLSGSTTISGGATLQLTGTGQIASSTAVTITGTLDISEVNTSATVNGISASGTINLGAEQLIIPTSSTISGTIQGTNGSLTVSGGTTGLSGSNSYTGPTTIGAGAQITAGSILALAQMSDFTITGTLDLQSFSNTIHSLNGMGNVISSSTGGTLTVTNGGAFSGVISNGNNLKLSGGILTLSGANTYTGTTMISGGTLALSGGGSLPSATALTNNGTFDISNINSSSQTIGNLSGAGSINLGDKELIVNLTAGSNYAGTLTGAGGSFDFFGVTNTLTLSGTGSNYTGPTIINSGTLQAGASPAFSAVSNVQMLGGTLDLNGNNNTLLSLSGSSGTVTSSSAALLTLTNGSNAGNFAGQISGSLSLNLTGGTLNLTGTTNSYSGATLIEEGATLSASGAGALSSSSAVTLETGGALISTANNAINGLSGDGTTTTSIGSGSTLTVAHGGTYSGLIEGAGSLSLSSGQLILSSNNTFSGTTTVASGATVQLVGSGSIAASSAVTLNGTLNIQGVTAPAVVQNLSGGSGASVMLGSEQLNVVLNNNTTYSGSISGDGGSLHVQTVQGLARAFSLNGTSGSCSYTGATVIDANAYLISNFANNLAAASAFTVNGTLLVDDFNTIATLGGTGVVSVATSLVLTVTSGGSFAGAIQGGGGLTVAGGTLSLTGASSNTYSGTTQISNNATLSAGATSAFSASSAFTVNGSLLLNSFNNSIASLSGVGTVNTGTTTGVGILTVSGGGSFSGGITGAGGLTLTGGTLLLSTTTEANTYAGATLLTGGSVLEAGATQAFAPDSAYTLTGSMLNLNGFNNTISSLTGDASSTVFLHSGAILTLDGAASTTFAGTMRNSGGGGLTIAGGNALTLSGTSNSYSGPTLIENGSLTITANGALSPYTDVTIDAAGTLSLVAPATANAANSVTNSGVLGTQEPLTLTAFYTQTSAATLDLGFDTALPTGQILTTNNITLDGTLDVTNTGLAPTSGFYTLLQSSSGLVSGTFSTFTPSGFTATPYLAYSFDAVNLFFSGCSETWAKAGNGFWNDAANWSGGSGGCVPGVNGNLNDVATFANLGPSSITVTLANDTGTAAQPVTLFQINFNASSTGYTLAPYSNLSTITLDSTGGAPQINVNAGSHTINAPIILNRSSDIFLADGTQLTFGASSSMTSASTQTLTIGQSLSSTTGSGLLLNNTTLTPYGLTLLSASIQNTGSIAPLSSLSISAASGQNATLLNSGTNASVGPTATGGTLSIGGAGTTTVVNDGSGASIGPAGINSTMTIGGTGTTTITNQGASVLLGALAAGSSVTVQGTGTTQILNSGVGARFGAFGTGGNLTLQSGVVTNSLGGLTQAGSGGTLTIAGGSIINDGLSTVGTSTSNLVLSSGQLTTSGDVLAFNYTQNSPGILQLNLSSNLSHNGNIGASGTATVGSTLIVNGNSASLAPGQIVYLITAQSGVVGTYPTVNFINFPVGVIPSLIYTPNAVELTTSSTVTPQSFGSFSQFTFTAVNELNILLERNIYMLHKRIRSRARKPASSLSNPQEKQAVASAALASNSKNILASAASFFITPSVAQQPLAKQPIAQQPQREQHFLAKKIVEEEQVNPSRFYFGPIDSFGTFKKQSTSQAGFDYNAVGCLTGIDHAFETFGLGLALEYTNTTGHVNHHRGKFNQDQLQATGYATFVPSSLNALAIDMLFGYGYEWISTKRKAGPAQSPVTAKANPQGQCVDLLLGGEYLFAQEQFRAMPKPLIVTPFLYGQYIWTQIGDYNEHHAGIYDLHVGSQIVNSLRSTLGARFEYTVERTNFIFKPELDIGWQYEFLRPDEKVKFTTLNLASTQTLSDTIVGGGRNTFLLGLDLFFTIHKVFELEMSYDFQWNNAYKINTFYLGIGGNF